MNASSGVFSCASNFLSKAVCTNQTGAMADGCGIWGGYFHCVDLGGRGIIKKTYTR